MTRSGRVRGRLRPAGRGTRMPCSTAANWVLSWRCPAVMTTESGRPLPSHARWNVVVSPPRLRPSPSSAGWTPPFFVGPAAPATRPARVLMRAGGRAIDSYLPDYLAHRLRSGLHVGEHPVPRPVTSPAVQPL